MAAATIRKRRMACKKEGVIYETPENFLSFYRGLKKELPKDDASLLEQIACDEFLAGNDLERCFGIYLAKHEKINKAVDYLVEFVDTDSVHAKDSVEALGCIEDPTTYDTVLSYLRKKPDYSSIVSLARISYEKTIPYIKKITQMRDAKAIDCIAQILYNRIIYLKEQNKFREFLTELNNFRDLEYSSKARFISALNSAVKKYNHTLNNWQGSKRNTN